MDSPQTSLDNRTSRPATPADSTLEVAAAMVVRLDPTNVDAKALPRVAPLRGANLPHEFGLDHNLLADIVWGAVGDLQSMAKKTVERYREVKLGNSRRYGSALGIAAFLVLCVVSSCNST